MFKEYGEYDALGLGELIRKGDVSPKDVLDAALAVANERNPEINALIHRFDERAYRQIEQGLPDGPFKGVPFVLKDLLACFAGEPLRMGSRGICVTPDYDSELVRRYKASGVNIFAKTNTPEFGLIITTEPKSFGPSHNPHKHGYSTGGSSGGSAAAVAAGIVPMAHGGDGGGSIRLPASWCGVFGLKPSRGRNPLGPDNGEDWQGAVAEHVLTRSVRDSAAMLDCSSGVELGAPYNIAPSKERFLAATQREAQPLRIAVSKRPMVKTVVDADVLAAVDLTVHQLRKLGHHVEETDPQIDADQLWRDFFVVVCAEVASMVERYRRLYGAAGVAKFEPATKNMAMLGRSFSAADLVTAKRGWHDVQLAMGRLLADFDVMLCPTVPTPAEPHGVLPNTQFEAFLMLASHRFNIGKLLLRSGLVEQMAGPLLAKMAFTIMGNVTGLPAMSVPLYLSKNGLPIGMQFTGRMADEATLFNLAAQLERELGFTC
ncbi:MAG: amidase [Zhongshania sp.]|uniref:amidase n=1 Tax=Zhongshania sp. TaxID=1971902 RepID=UPI0026068470|nr:amidase [Zhongshania sp.]MDF1692198.1 amidase [Zhongshania sp.]